MALPYPGILTDKERANFDSGIFVPPLNFIYFTFNATLYKKSKVIGTIPKNGMVYGTIQFRVTEAFTRSTYKLALGLSPSTIDLGTSIVGAQNIVVKTVFLGGLAQGYLSPLDQERNIVLSLIPNQVEDAPTSGAGFGIMTWLNLNLIQGFFDGS